MLAVGAQRVRLIDHEQRTVALLHLHELGKRCRVAEHAVQTLDHHQRSSRALLQSRQTLVEAVRIVVLEAVDGRLGHGRAVV